MNYINETYSSPKAQSEFLKVINEIITSNGGSEAETFSSLKNFTDQITTVSNEEISHQKINNEVKAVITSKQIFSLTIEDSFIFSPFSCKFDSTSATVVYITALTNSIYSQVVNGTEVHAGIRILSQEIVKHIQIQGSNVYLQKSAIAIYIGMAVVIIAIIATIVIMLFSFKKSRQTAYSYLPKPIPLTSTLHF